MTLFVFVPKALTMNVLTYHDSSNAMLRAGAAD